MTVGRETTTGFGADPLYTDGAAHVISPYYPTRMTTAQRLALTVTTFGHNYSVFDTDLGVEMVYIGLGVTTPSVAADWRKAQQFTATGDAHVTLRDSSGAAIDSLGSPNTPKSLNTAGIANVSYTDTSANIALSTISAVAGDTLRIYAPTDVYIEFGSSAPTADSNSMYFAAGTEKVTVPASATHIAIVRVTSSGTANIQVMV